jgi:hypothetical protein
VTLDDIRQQIRAHVVLSATDLTDPQLDEFVWTTIERLQQTADWHFQENSVQFPFPANSYVGVPLPDDFVVEAAVYQFMPQSTSAPANLLPIGRLPGGRFDWAVEANRQDRNESFPVPASSRQAYYIWMDQLWLVPAQSSDITVQLDYYADPPDPVQPTDTTGLVGVSPRTVLWGALQLCYLYLHELELAGAAGQIYDELTDAAFKREQGRRMGATQYTRTR